MCFSCAHFVPYLLHTTLARIYMKDNKLRAGNASRFHYSRYTRAASSPPSSFAILLLRAQWRHRTKKHFTYFTYIIELDALANKISSAASNEHCIRSISMRCDEIKCMRPTDRCRRVVCTHASTLTPLSLSMHGRCAVTPNTSDMPLLMLFLHIHVYRVGIISFNALSTQNTVDEYPLPQSANARDQRHCAMGSGCNHNET